MMTGIQGAPKPTLQIAVLTYNRPQSVILTLEKIAKIGIPRLAEFFEVSVCVFDNANDSSVRKIIDSYPEFNLVQHTRNLGLSGNFNYALEQCDCDWIWIVSDDDDLEFEWAASFPYQSDVDHIILMRRDRFGNVVCEDSLQRNIGLSNNIYKVSSSKTGLAKLREHNIENATYPQVVLGQVLRFKLVDNAAYTDNQLAKNYSLSGFLRVVIRDATYLATSAHLLRAPLESRKLAKVLALSHLAHYGLPFLSSSVSCCAKAELARVLRITLLGAPMSVLLFGSTLRWSVQASMRWPRAVEVLGKLGLRLAGLAKFVVLLEHAEKLVPKNEGTYFDYDPESDK